MLGLMSETPSSSEPATGPVATASPPGQNRLTAVAAWVGIVAGAVFIVAVIFFSGFFLGAQSGGHRGWGHGDRDRDFAIIHKGGPPPMFPMGPRGDFEGPSPRQPTGPSTTAPRP
jgi:hypothetical protein